MRGITPSTVEPSDSTSELVNSPFTLAAGCQSGMPGFQTRSAGISQPCSAKARTFASGTGPKRSPFRA